MDSPSSHIKIKLIISYIVFLLLLLVTLFLTYQKVRIYTTVEQGADFRTDSIVTLIEEKDHKIVDLIQSIGDLNTEFLNSSLEIENYLKETSETPVIQKKVITTSDTLVAKEKEDNLLDRLVDAFVPKVEDTVKVKRRIETRIDTLYEDDSNKQTVAKLQKRLKRERVALERRQQRADDLKLLNVKITQEIDSLLRHYEQAQLNNILNQVEKGNEDRKKAIKWIGAVAIISILLIIVFSTYLLRDINRSNRYRKELEKANRRAEKLLRTREKLMLTITHDIKAPIGTIIGYAELLDSTGLKTQQKEYLSSIHIATDHVLKLVQDLLDYHLLDLNKVILKNEEFYLRSFIDEILESFIPLYQKKGLELSIDCDEEALAIWINSDPHRIKQIINNLLSNALKFTNEGGVVVRVKVDGERLIWIVKDTGRGIPIDEQQRIFNEFTRLPGAQGKEGFGLGLSIVSKLVEAMHGVIRVVSTPGKGSLFTVILPFQAAKKRQVASKKQGLDSENQKTLLLLGLKILTIDDDRLQLKLTKTVLENAGAEVSTCETVEELLLMLDKQRYDLLITDIQMPEITGFDLVLLLRNSNKLGYKETPILAVSAQEVIDMDFFIKRGFIGALSKPFIAEDIALIWDSYNNKKVLNLNDKIEPQTLFKGLFSFLEDDEAKTDVLRTFIRETELNLAQLEGCVSREDLEQVSKVAHKMIPIMKMLGQNKICASLIKLERRDFSLSLEDCKSEIVYLKEEILNLVKIAKEELGN